MCEIQTVV